MDLAQLRARARQLSGVLMATLVSDERVDEYVNAAYLAIGSVAEWSWLFAEQQAVTDSADVSLPGGIGRVQDVSLEQDGSWQLQRRSTVDIARQPPSRNVGPPWAWAPLGADSIRIFPSPTEEVTLTVRGWTSPQPLGPTDSPAFDEEFHDVVAYEAAAAMLQAEGDDSGRTERFRREVEGFLDRMARRYLPDGGQVAYPPAEVAAPEPGGEDEL